MKAPTQRALTRVAAAVGALLLVGWGVAQWRASAAVDRFRTAYLTAPETLLQVEGAPPLAIYPIRMAELLSEELFPPNHTQAEQRARQAIELDPMSSRAWLALARTRLFKGEPEAARRALARSDELDPRYPSERLESVRLWALLDERARGMATALAVASLSEDLRRQAAVELLSSGYQPVEILEALQVSTLPPEEIVGLIERVRSADQARMSAIYALIPESAYRSREFRERLARVAIDPLNIAMIEKLWHLDGTAFDSHDGILLEDPRLTSPPFSSAFPLGWQALSERDTRLRVSWEAPRADGANGRIQIENPRFGHEDYRYPFYRFILPAGRQVSASVMIRDGSNYGQRVAFSAIERDGGRIEYARSVPRFSEPQRLQVTIPAAERARVITMSIRVEREETLERREGDLLWIEGVSVGQPETLRLREAPAPSSGPDVEDPG